MRRASLALTLCLVGCNKPAEPTHSAPPASAAAPTKPAAAGPLAWTDPTGWKRNPPSNAMRLAEYVVPKVGSEDAPECVINTFGAGQGGSVDANIDRWIRQFDPGSASSVDKQSRKINGLDVTFVELSGTFKGMAMPGAPTTAKPNQRMVAAIVDHPTGPHFFKMVGPDASVKEAKAAFVTMIESVR
jgi:hypothetical protein